MRTWLLGRDTWAYPWMKWFGMPMTRIGVLLVGGSLLISGHSNAVTAAGAGLLAASIAMELANYLILQTHKQRQPTAY
jgi:hypothetical protein